MNIILLAVLLLLVGCQGKTTNPDPTDHPKQFYDTRHIEIVTLKDGTRCAVAMYPGGLSCEFAQIKHTPKRGQ